MIEFTDGTTITCEEAAQLIEAEGQVGIGDFAGPHYRCSLGIIEGWAHETQESTRTVLGMSIRQGAVQNGDAFEGTPEERSVFMAAYFRSLPEEGITADGW